MTGQGYGFASCDSAIAVFAALRAVTRAKCRRMCEDEPAASAPDPGRALARGEIRREEYEERKRAMLTMSAPTGNL